MLVLSQDDVRRLLPMEKCIELMSDALSALARGEVVLPLRTMMRLPDSPNILATMPAYYGARRVAGVKVITVFPGNHGTELDSHQGAVLLFDGDNGSLLAIMDATTITAIRTAAVSALATRLLAREDARDLAILGAGVQGMAHLEAIPCVRDIERLRVWSRNTEKARALAAAASHMGIPEVVVEPTPQHAVSGAAIVCTCTASHEPVLEGAWLSPGAHVNAVGACTPDARELDTEAVARARLYVDRRESALAEPGEILEPLREGAIGREHIVAELGEVAAGLAPGRGDADEITLFESLGLAIEDVASAHWLYHAALEEGAGTRVELGGRRDAVV